MKVYYMDICPKCADMKLGPCKSCNVEVAEKIPTDITLEEYRQLSNKEKNELVEHYIETLIKDTYDPEARKYREENEIPTSQRGGLSRRRAKCPSCGSRSLSKISTVKKAAKVGLFGIFGAGDIGKTYKCNNCGVRF